MIRRNIGSSYPLFPRTGYVQYQGEAVAWQEHDLENWNLYFTFAGAGEVLFANERLRTEVGDLLVLPPRLERRYQVAEAKQGWGFYFLHFLPTAKLKTKLAWFSQRGPQTHRVTNPTARNRTMATLEEMFQLNLRTPEIKERAELMGALLECLLLRISGTEASQGTAGSGIDPRVGKAVEAFHEDFGRRHTLDALARIAGLSRSQFCLLFRAAMGRSPQDYMEERRMELARFYLMTTASSIGEIASNIGFDDPFYFCTRFRRRFEQSPSMYRRANRGLGGKAGFWTPELLSAEEIARKRLR